MLRFSVLYEQMVVNISHHPSLKLARTVYKLHGLSLGLVLKCCAWSFLLMNV